MLPAALPWKRRVSARRGWAGENSDLFDHPVRKKTMPTLSVLF